MFPVFRFKTVMKLIQYINHMRNIYYASINGKRRKLWRDLESDNKLQYNNVLLDNEMNHEISGEPGFTNYISARCDIAII